MRIVVCSLVASLIVACDDLGPPWPVHPCWQEYRDERRRAIVTCTDVLVNFGVGILREPTLALLCQVIPLGYRVTGSWQYGQRKRMTFKIAVSTSWRLISGRLGLGGGAARFSRRALFPRV